MTQTPPDDRRWQQPSWQASDPDGVQDPPPPPPVAEPLSGTVLVPAAPRRPPSVIESSFNVIGAVTWPAAIALAIFGVGSWWLDIALAVVISSLAGAIATEMKKRRKQ